MGKLVLLIFLLSDTCYSQGQYIQFGAGSSFSSTDLSASIPGFSSSFSWGYDFDSGINIEADLEFDYLNFAANKFAENTLLLSSGFLFGYNFGFIENSTFRFQLGGTLFKSRPDLKNSQSSTSSLSYSLISKSSLHFPISEHFVFFQTISNNLTFSDNLDGLKSGSGNDRYFSVSLGIEYYFSGNKKFIAKSESETKDLYEAPLKKDSDSDGIADYKDDCPEIPGTKQNHGCPDEDSDNDGIPNTLDTCQDEAETFNGYLDEDGCPDSVVEKSEVKNPQPETQIKVPEVEPVISSIPIETVKPEIVPENPKPAETVKPATDFINLSFPKGSSTFKREQVEPLSEFVKKHKTAKSITLTVYCWENQVYSDNQKLAEKRASNIKKFLVQMGIGEKSLTIVSEGKKPKFSDATSNQYYEVKIQ